MRYSFGSALLAVGAVLTPFVSASPTPHALDSRVSWPSSKCDNDGLQVGRHKIGGEDGEFYCDTRFRDSGAVVKGMEVWADGGTVRGLQFFFTDNKPSEIHGTTAGRKSSKIDWDPTKGELISSATLYGNGKGNRLGRVVLRTSTGKTLDVGKDSTKGQDSFNIDVGAGIMLGGFGYKGKDVDALAFMFLKSKVSKIKVKDITLDADIDILDEEKAEELDMLTLSKVRYFFDESSNNETSAYWFWNTLDKTVSTEYIQETSNMWGLSLEVEVEFKVFEIGGKVTGGFQWEHTKTRSQSDTTSNKIGLQWRIEVKVSKGKSVLCTSQAMMGKIDGGYDSTVELTLENGDTVEYSERGRMKAISYSEAFAMCSEDEETIEGPMNNSDENTVVLEEESSD